MNLAGKYLLVPVVIGECGKDRAVRGQCDGRKAWSLGQVAANQFGCDVLGIGGTAPVATEQHLAAALQAGCNGLASGGDGMLARAQASNGGCVTSQVIFKEGGHRNQIRQG